MASKTKNIPSRRVQRRPQTSLASDPIDNKTSQPSAETKGGGVTLTLKVSFILPPLETRTARTGGDEEKDRGLRDGKERREKEMMDLVDVEGRNRRGKREGRRAKVTPQPTRAGLGGGRCLTAL